MTWIAVVNGVTHEATGNTYPACSTRCSVMFTLLTEQEWPSALLPRGTDPLRGDVERVDCLQCIVLRVEREVAT